MRKMYVFIFAGFLLALATVAFAARSDSGPTKGSMMKGPGDASGGMDHQAAVHKLGTFLKLTPEQKERMKDVGSRFWTDTRELRYEIKLKKLEMRKLVTDPKTDDQKLLAKEKEINALVHNLMDRKAQMKIEWRRVLTPEQIQKLDILPEGFQLSYRDPSLL